HLYLHFFPTRRSSDLGDDLARFQIEQTHHDRRRAEIDREAVDGTGAAIDFFAFEQDAIAITGDSGFEFPSATIDRQLERVLFDRSEEHTSELQSLAYL